MSTKIIKILIQVFAIILILVGAGLWINLNTFSVVDSSFHETEEEWTELNSLMAFQGDLNKLISYTAFHQVVQSPNRIILLDQIDKAKGSLAHVSTCALDSGHHAEEEVVEHIEQENLYLDKLNGVFDNYAQKVKEYIRSNPKQLSKEFLKSSYSDLLIIQSATYELEQVYTDGLKKAVDVARQANDQVRFQIILISSLLILLIILVSALAVYYLNARAKIMVQEEKLLTIGALTRSLIHEIRNPLGIIKSSASVLQNNVEDDKEINKELIQYMSDEVDRIDNLMSQLLSLEGKENITLNPVDLTATIEQTITLLEAKLQKYCIEIEFNNDAQGSRIECNEDQIKQLLMNIIINAVHASEKGGKIVIQTTVRDKEYILSIQDYGKGIPKDVQKRIFDAFYTTKDKGLGIGLLIVKRIVDKHLGSIEVQSELNQGTMFTIKFPLYE